MTEPSGTAACAFGDPTCPCQDGDVCHYVDDPLSETLAMEPPKTAATPFPNGRDERLYNAALHMEADHGPDHERHKMWSEMARLIDHLAYLSPYWQEPYAAPFVPIIEAGVGVAVAYEEARSK